MRRWATAFLTLAVVLAACGTGTESGSSTTVPASPSTTTMPPVTTSAPTTTTTSGPITTTTVAATTTTTQVPPLDLAIIEARLLTEWPTSVAATMWSAPDAWSCEYMTSGSIGVDSVAKCVPAPQPEGQFPVLTVLVLDPSGTISVSQAGVVYPVLNADAVVDMLGSGMFCRDILGDSRLTQDLSETDMQFFGAVLYWSMEGMPPRMDADENGIPCETLVPADVVRTVWDGAWVEG